MGFIIVLIIVGFIIFVYYYGIRVVINYNKSSKANIEAARSKALFPQLWLKQPLPPKVGFHSLYSPLGRFLDEQRYQEQLAVDEHNRRLLKEESPQK